MIRVVRQLVIRVVRQLVIRVVRQLVIRVVCQPVIRIVCQLVIRVVFRYTHCDGGVDTAHGPRNIDALPHARPTVLHDVSYTLHTP